MNRSTLSNPEKLKLGPEHGEALISCGQGADVTCPSIARRVIEVACIRRGFVCLCPPMMDDPDAIVGCLTTAKGLEWAEKRRRMP